MEESRFEVIVMPNIYSKTDGEKGEIATILCADSYDEAIELMKRDIEKVKDSPNAKAYHYDIWEYAEPDFMDVKNEWVFDWKGNSVNDFKAWLDNLTENELLDV